MSFAYKQKIYNCPNCAAPIGKDDICPYCGTRLRWIPFVEREIKTVYMNVQKVGVEQRVRRDLSEFMSPDQINEMTERDMAMKFAEFMPKIWRVEKFDDCPGREMIYRAHIWVGEEDKTMMF